MPAPPNHPHTCANSSSPLSNRAACLALFLAQQLSSTACHSIAVKTNIQSNFPHTKSTFRTSFVYPRACTAGSKIFPRHTVPLYSVMTILLPNSCDPVSLSTRCYQSTNSFLISQSITGFKIPHSADLLARPISRRYFLVPPPSSPPLSHICELPLSLAMS